MTKEPKTLPDIVFNNFQRGISDSAYLADLKMPGIASLTAADISSSPGILKCGFQPVKKSGVNFDYNSFPLWIVRNPGNSNLYALNSDGTAYVSSDSGETWAGLSNTTTAGVGNGLGVYKDYLYIARNTNLDKYGPLSGSPSFSYGVQTLTTSTWHPMIWGPDDIFYIGNSSTVASLNAGGTFTGTALSLPTDHVVKSLAFLGKYLMVGTYGGTNYPVLADIFPWDPTKASFELPLRFEGDGINAMTTVGQLTYVLHGITGNISATNGTNIFPLKKVNYAVNYTYNPNPGGICNMNGKPYFAFGIGADKDWTSRGIYSLNPVNIYGQGTVALNCEATTSATAAPNSTCEIGAICPVDSYKYLIGWRDTTNLEAGIDLVAGSGYRRVGYKTSWETQFMNVGGVYNKRKFDKITFQLAKPLATGQGVQVSYRYDRNASYTGIAIWDFTTYGAISENIVNNAFPGKETNNIQLKITMVSAANSTDCPELMEVRLKGGVG